MFYQILKCVYTPNLFETCFKVGNDDLKGKRTHFTGFCNQTISGPKIPKTSKRRNRNGHFKCIKKHKFMHRNCCLSVITLCSPPKKFISIEQYKSSSVLSIFNFTAFVFPDKRIWSSSNFFGHICRRTMHKINYILR